MLDEFRRKVLTGRPVTRFEVGMATNHLAAEIVGEKYVPKLTVVRTEPQRGSDWTQGVIS
jgi:hypothetical protein